MTVLSPASPMIPSIQDGGGDRPYVSLFELLNALKDASLLQKCVSPQSLATPEMAARLLCKILAHAMQNNLFLENFIAETAEPPFIRILNREKGNTHDIYIHSGANRLLRFMEVTAIAPKPPRKTKALLLIILQAVQACANLKTPPHNAKITHPVTSPEACGKYWIREIAFAVRAQDKKYSNFNAENFFP